MQNTHLTKCTKNVHIYVCDLRPLLMPLMREGLNFYSIAQKQPGNLQIN